MCCRFALGAFPFGRRLLRVMRGCSHWLRMLPLPALAPSKAPACVGAYGGVVGRQHSGLCARRATSSSPTDGPWVARPVACHRLIRWRTGRIRRFLHSASASRRVWAIVYGESCFPRRVQGSNVWPAVHRLRYGIGTFGGSCIVGLATGHYCKYQVGNLRAC